MHMVGDEKHGRDVLAVYVRTIDSTFSLKSNSSSLSLSSRGVPGVCFGRCKRAEEMSVCVIMRWARICTGGTAVLYAL